MRGPKGVHLWDGRVPKARKLRRFWGSSLVASEDGQKCRDDVWVELRRAAAEQFGDRVGGIQTHAIRPILGHRVVGVDDRDDAAADGNRGAGELARIAA